MSPDEIQQLKLAVLATAAYYSNPIKDDVLSMIIDDLEDLPFAEVGRALKELRQDPKVIRFPLPAQIRQRIQPQLSEGQEAREIAARAVGAVTRFGYSNTLEAQAYIGEHGWRCINLMGDWSSFCQGLTDFNVTQFQAQIRELAETQIVKTKADGTYLEMKNKRIELPPPGEFRTFECKMQIEDIRRLALKNQLKLLSEGRGDEIKPLAIPDSGMKSAGNLLNFGIKSIDDALKGTK